MKLADAVIVTNETYRRKIATRHGLSPDKIYVVRNDVTTLASGCPAPLGDVNAHRKLVLLYLGHINRQDGIDTLIRALHVLVREFHEDRFVCVVVGKGESLPGARHLAAELEMSPFIEFKGYEPIETGSRSISAMQTLVWSRRRTTKSTGVPHSSRFLN